ncbi:MAG: Holliday junction resolvase RuvX [Clostridia bacterium]|nr:Holliday junction resolvase RuvX [Clostridia bacterium]
MVIISVDLGDARTGTAVCDKGEILASPLGTIYERDLEKLANTLTETAKERRAEMFVVGLPLNMDGSCGERGEKCKEFAKLLEEKSGLPVELSDERLTTVQAHNALNFTNTRGKKRHGVVDTVAAVMILENFLMKRKNR